MGTNYYWNANPCESCGRTDKQIHIGKSSLGWTFSFHATDTIRSFKDWLKTFEGDGYISDEYGEKITVRDFVTMVTLKQDAKWNHARDVFDPNSDYNQYEMAAYPGYRILHNYHKDYLDAEGYSFSEAEFC